MEQVLTQLKFPCRSSEQSFWVDSFLVSETSPDPPARLTSQYQSSSSGATLKAGYTKHVVPMLLTYNSEFWSVFKGSPKKSYDVLWQPFHRDCKRGLNDMVVTYKVPYSNNNDWEEFSWTWKAPDSVNCLKMLFHLKNRQALFTHPVYTWGETIHNHKTQNRKPNIQNKKTKRINWKKL